MFNACFSLDHDFLKTETVIPLLLLKVPDKDLMGLGTDEYCCLSEDRGFLLLWIPYSTYPWSSSKLADYTLKIFNR